MNDFELAMKTAMEKQILKSITEGNWLNIPYDSRVKVPHELIQSAWALVDTDGIRQRLKERIENELADRIMNHLAAEMATDIKQLLGVQERREALRAIARQHLESIMKIGV